MHKKIILLFVILSALLLGSCKSKNKFIPSAEAPNASLRSVKYEITNQPIINFLSAKAKVTISNSENSEKGVLYIRSKKDSVLWMAVKKLSVEGGRAQITTDSIYTINRLEKSYTKSSIDSINKQYGLIPKLTTMQDLIAGILPSIDTFSYLETKEDSAFYTLRTMSNGYLVDVSLNKALGKISEVKFYDKINGSLTCQFDDYRIINDTITLPFYRKYYWANSDTVSLEMKINEITINEPQRIKFNIPNHYKEIK